MKKSKSMLITFLLPAILIFATIFIYPIFRTTLMSLYKVDRVTASFSEWEFVGLANYIKLFETPLFITSLWNMMKIWLIGGVCVMSISLLFAGILNSGIRFKKFFRAAIYMPNVISAVALAIMWLQFVFNNQYGLLKSFFEMIGAHKLAAIQWTGPEFLFWSLLIAYSFGMVGYHMLIFSSGIEKIPQDYFSAAYLDGAGKIKQFFYITIPLIKGVMRTNIIMWSITSVGFFLWSRLFSSVTADTATITPLVYLYLQTFSSGVAVTETNAGLGSAVGVIMGIIVVVMFIVVNLVLKDDNLEI